MKRIIKIVVFSLLIVVSMVACSEMDVRPTDGGERTTEIEPD